MNTSSATTEEMKEIALVLEFEDQGQDFLLWHIAADGEVLVCSPFQAWLWEGRFVHDPSELGVGDLVTITLDDEPYTVKYPLVKVTPHEDA